MKRFYDLLVLITLVVIGTFSCSKADAELDNVNAVDYKGAVLHVSELSTRVDFDDNGTQGIDINWELDDVFTLYNAEGERVDDFKCKSVSDGVFESLDENTSLIEDASYTAIYPASSESTLEAAKSAINVESQNGDLINNMDNSCYMLVDFNYAIEGQDITFIHQMSIMTFKFTRSTLPSKIVFQNGDDSYEVTYSDLTSTDDCFVSHIMINPCEAVERDLIFTFYDGSTKAETVTLHSTRGYEAGVRYTASINRFSGGIGTQASPYLISAPEDFVELSAAVNGGEGFAGEYFTMTKDVDLEGIVMEPIGSKVSFQAAFDGCGFSVKNLNVISAVSGSSVGLFGFVSGSNAIVENLHIVNGHCTTNYDGCHTGLLVGTLQNGATLLNCSGDSKSSVTASNQGVMGGLVGALLNSGKIQNCDNHGALTVNSTSEIIVGGLVGNTTGGSIDNCYLAGKVSATTTSTKEVGGAVGQVSNVTINNCYFDYTVYVESFGTVGIMDPKKDSVKIVLEEVMVSDVFIKTLNNNAAGIANARNWVEGADGFPELSDGTPVESEFGFSGGSGTSEDPYLLSNTNDLFILSTTTNIGNSYNGTHFKLTNDVDLENMSWVSIGYSQVECFEGAFDGDGYSIQNYNEEANVGSGIVSIGLFGYISGANAVVKNLLIEDGHSVMHVVGTHAGIFVGTLQNGATLSQCACDARSTVTTNARSAVGGLVGALKGGNIIDCYNQGSVIVTDDFDDDIITVGGLIGSGFYGNDVKSTITNSYNAGAVKCSTTFPKYNKGAFLGAPGDKNVYTNCYYLMGCAGEGVLAEDAQPGHLVGDNITGVTSKTDEEMKLLAASLGDNWVDTSTYPTLKSFKF